uniref:DUF4210 domain-containing protein n=1 Tax=Heligmosomoides polygyrus TaxID=6339 RepID=A0A8L8JZD7_HELPZ
LWTIRREWNSQVTGLAPLFLKNAIRSHLHFSQLNSWISTQNGRMPDGISYTYRICQGVCEQIGSEGVTEHTFPVCRMDRQSILVVSVKYVKSERMPVPIGLCLQLGALPTDQWLAPSPVGSPTDDCPLSATPTPEAIAISSDPLDEYCRHARCLRRERRAVWTRKRSTSWPVACRPSKANVDDNGPRAADRFSTNSFSASDIVLPESRLPRHQPSSLLGNFEESALNGRLDPVKRLDGFKLQLAASGAFSSPHTSLTVTAYFFDLNDSETAPSPYLGTCSLESLGKRGYRVPKSGTIQATLFNPQDTVVKVFVIAYDMSDMPPSSQTFIRQRTFLATDGDEKAEKHLVNLIHFRLATDRRCRLYLHTDVRMLFSQNNTLDALNLELKGRVGHDSADRYRLIVETELPRHPRYSPKK